MTKAVWTAQRVEGEYVLKRGFRGDEPSLYAITGPARQGAQARRIVGLSAAVALENASAADFRALASEFLSE